MTERDRLFRWDGDTKEAAAMAGAMCVTDVVVGFAAPWWVTTYVAVLTVWLFATTRLCYWQNRKMELLTRGSMMDSPEVAAEAVAAHNERPARPRSLRFVVSARVVRLCGSTGTGRRGGGSMSTSGEDHDADA